MTYTINDRFAAHNQSINAQPKKRRLTRIDDWTNARLLIWPNLFRLAAHFQTKKLRNLSLHRELFIAIYSLYGSDMVRARSCVTK